MDVSIREAQQREAEAIRSVALEAHLEYESVLSSEDWHKMERGVYRITHIAEEGSLFVAEVEDRIAGAVVYLPPGSPRPGIFEPEWSVVRMLSVSPKFRGRGAGLLLSEMCLEQARRDGAGVIGLHTGEMMSAAQKIYERLGFEVLREIEPRFGFRYWIFTKTL